ncbi:MAG TPA: response regulator [Verrucomicrobiae bacterium]|nr:response regulator [Verrucomicrobiae bacterium]
MSDQKINILLVDDQPAKLLSYRVILEELGETLLSANSAQEAFEHLNRSEIAVVLVDVYMPDLDGFELARMIREHPRFKDTAIILISAVLLADMDFLRGYQHGAVDYISVPVIPEVLRAKVKVFADLYRKTKQLERFNQELEERVAERTSALELAMADLQTSEGRLQLALEAANMGWWSYDIKANKIDWSQTLVRLMGFSPEAFGGTWEGMLAHAHADDRHMLKDLVHKITPGNNSKCEVRFVKPDGSVRWALTAGHIVRSADGEPSHFFGLDLDTTERRKAADRQELLVRELDHRAKNLLAVVQSVVRLTKASTIADFVKTVEGRILALARAHTLLSEARWASVDLKRLVEEEIEPFHDASSRIHVQDSTSIPLEPAAAQSMAMVVHELLTNAIKYGSLSKPEGVLNINWELSDSILMFHWRESHGSDVTAPKRQGFGFGVINANIASLNGRVSFEWNRDGLQCQFAIPMGRREWTDLTAPPVEKSEIPEPANAQNRPQRPVALIVEDEPLIAKLTKDLLVDIGCDVIGPFAVEDTALKAANELEFDVALLDLNINGRFSYPVAKVLVSRRIPFAFLTGYNIESVDPAFSQVPVLAKPIDPGSLTRFLASLQHLQRAGQADTFTDLASRVAMTGTG